MDYTLYHVEISYLEGISSVDSKSVRIEFIAYSTKKLQGAQNGIKRIWTITSGVKGQKRQTNLQSNF